MPKIECKACRRRKRRTKRIIRFLTSIVKWVIILMPLADNALSIINNVKQ